MKKVLFFINLFSFFFIAMAIDSLPLWGCLLLIASIIGMIFTCPKEYLR